MLVHKQWQHRVLYIGRDTGQDQGSSHARGEKQFGIFYKGGGNEIC